jgi:hypothetical protein
MKMTEYEFELIFKLTPGEDPAQRLDALFEAGCDDALPGIGQKGYIALTFNREAKDAKSAILSAMENVKDAIPHSMLESAGPYLLNLTELAFEFGVTKQYMQKLARSNASFPAPFINGKTSYWKADEVALWLNNGVKVVDPRVIETLQKIRALNLALEKHRISDDPDFEDKLKEVA